MANYEDAVLLSNFQGIWQQNGDSSLAKGYAYDAYNMATERGRLARAAGYEKALPPLPARIGTLARFYRRHIEDEANREVFVAVTLDGIYTYIAGDDAWIRRYPETGVLKKDDFDSITYEAAVKGVATDEDSAQRSAGGNPSAAGDGAQNGETVDILILTNNQDGMICIYGNDLHAERKTIRAVEGGPEILFNILGRHAERIWAAGVPGEPDNLYYSHPYDPFNWSANEAQPELGGGMIQQPTWNGDEFIALRALGGYMMAIRKSSMFAIRGTDPSTYVVDEMYGDDCPRSENSIAIDGTRMFYMAEGGIGVFDGQSAQLLAKDALYETMRMRANDFLRTECACTAGHVYYLSLRVRENANDKPAANNTVIEYDTRRGTFMIRKGISIDSFLAVNGTVYCTSGGNPGRVYRYGAGDTYDGAGIETLWKTGYLDENGKNVNKSAFTVRFYAEGEQGATLSVTIETEKKRKTKTVALTPKGKQHKIRIQNKGKKFALEITSSGVQPWEIRGGIQVDYEIDEE